MNRTVGVFEIGVLGPGLGHGLKGFRARSEDNSLSSCVEPFVNHARPEPERSS
jgi:hypothetical protein